MASEIARSGWTHTIHEPVVESKLCQRCSFLGIDDTTDGFQLREVDEDEEGPPPAWLSGPGLDFCEKRDSFYREIRVDSQHSDQLPDLNGLRVSAEAGCAFCGALRDAMLTLCLDAPGKVTFDLRYLWSPLPYQGLHFLSVSLNVETEDRESIKHEGRILFSASSRPGKHCS
jgi:hypothetical protein